MDDDQDPRKRPAERDSDSHPSDAEAAPLASQEQPFDDFLSEFEDEGFGTDGSTGSTPSLDAPPRNPRRRHADPERRLHPLTDPGQVRSSTAPSRPQRRPADPEGEPRIELDPSRDAALLAALQDVEALATSPEEAARRPRERAARVTSPTGRRRLRSRPPAEAAPRQRGADVARVRDLERRLGEAAAESDGLRRKLRTMADDTSRCQKRLEGQAAEAREQGREDVFRILVTLIDNLEAALQTSAEGRDFDRLHQGLELVVRQFQTDFKALGLRPFDSDGQPFDPTYHEAFAALQTGAAEPGTVIKTVRRGYFFGDKLLRPALVMVEGSGDS